MRITKWLLFVFLLLALTVACGGGGGDVENTGTEVETAVEATNTPAAATPTEEPTPEPEPTAPPATETPEPSNAVASLQDVQQATIRIVAEGSFVDPEAGMLLNTAGSGSGFIIDESGIAVTNNHVVTGAALLRVYVGGASEPVNARILGVSECSDLAVIDLDGGDYPYLEWFDGNITTGLDVYAAGFPLGDPEFTLTRGIVSKENASGYTNWSAVASVLEHDATINPGNSGGPLINADGQIVGVNYASNPNFNQYFAIARDEALDVIAELREGNDVDSIGVNGVAVSDGATFSGIWVSSVESGSPADQAGLEGGDIITLMEGLQLATNGTMEDYCDILRTRSADDVMSIEVLRFQTGELLEGQLNGRELEVASTFGGDGGDGGNGGDAGDVAYVTIFDDTGAIQMDVPDSWNDVNGAAWERDGQVLGAGLSASPDLDGFYGSFDVPGVFFGASARLAGQYTPDSYLDEIGGFSSCTYDDRYSYDDGVYVGVYDLFTDCSGSGASIINLAAIASDGSHLAFVQVQTVTAADDAAAEQIFNTFIASGDLGGAPVSSGDVVYATEFDNVDDWSGFTVPEGDDYLAERRGSTLYVEVPVTDSTAYAVQDTAFAEDVRIDAGVETVAGPNRNNISLVCRYSSDGWYEFSMNSGGYWYIYKYASGDGYSILADGASTAINLQKAENELTAVCVGNDLTFVINGTEVGSATDTEFRGGGIGVSVSTFDIAGAGVEFDWLVATVP
ncbi:MAG: serine protease [Anaerolineales bacterium]|nr:serine protease [Anaerolineales bacterium]